MIFRETPLHGAFLVEPEPVADERGFFARTWCTQEARRMGVTADVVQCNVSYNRRAGTLRGLHWQARPHAEAKLVRCTHGAIYDVIVDLRRTSPTFGRYLAVTLSRQNRLMLYVPEGFAHGFQTLEDETEVFYQMSAAYHAPSARGIVWNDPTLAIPWPDVGARIVSARDLALPRWEDLLAAAEDPW